MSTSPIPDPIAIGVAVGALAPIAAGRGSLPKLALGVALSGLVLAPLGDSLGLSETGRPAVEYSSGLFSTHWNVAASREYPWVWAHFLSFLGTFPIGYVS